MLTVVPAALFQPFPMLPGRAAQVWRHQPEYRRPRHFHEETEVNAVVRGSALVGIGDRTLELGPGELVMFEPGQDHVLLEASDDLELFVFALRPELAASASSARSANERWQSATCVTVSPSSAKSSSFLRRLARTLLRPA